MLDEVLARPLKKDFAFLSFLELVLGPGLLSTSLANMSLQPAQSQHIETSIIGDRIAAKTNEYIISNE